jgi:hypothetical protein
MISLLGGTHNSSISFERITKLNSSMVLSIPWETCKNSLLILASSLNDPSDEKCIQKRDVFYWAKGT